MCLIMLIIFLKIGSVIIANTCLCVLTLELNQLNHARQPFGVIFVTTLWRQLATKLRDVHFNQCFEERAGHVL